MHAADRFRRVSVRIAALLVIVIWALLFAASAPIHSAYLNGLIPSQQRATILSFDSMIGSSGGVVVQPVLGRAADVWGYAGSYVLGAGISAFALPFVLLARREGVPADTSVGPKYIWVLLDTESFRRRNGRVSASPWICRACNVIRRLCFHAWLD